MAKYYDFASTQAKLGEMILHAPKFPLSPQNMAALTLPVTLQWEKIPFNQQNADSIIEKPGVYAFAVAQ